MAEPFRQILFASVARAGCAPGVVNSILSSARSHNDHDRVTGMMYADGGRYVQALEGPPDAVEATFSRIRADGRHHHITVLSDRATDRREFGGDPMAFHDETDERLEVDHRMRDALMQAPPVLRERFLDLIDD